MLPAGHHTDFYRNTVEGQDLHSHSIEEAVHRSVLTPKDLSPQDLRAADADVITDSYRERVQPVRSGSCQILLSCLPTVLKRVSRKSLSRCSLLQYLLLSGIWGT